jgi:CDP-glucose 4,6-dehydratase
MTGSFSGAYAGTRVLVTGHTGFKGSWLCLWLQALGARVTGLALDPDTTPAHWSLLALDGIDDRRIDLRDARAVHATLADCRPEVVFHLAAQPLVRRSYREPAQTFASNVTGLVNLLEAVRSVRSVKALVNVTTDKVYSDSADAATAGYREDAPLGGHDPYSTSKACAELVTDCYRKSYLAAEGTRIATARAGNVIGGGDWSEDRLVPDLVRAATSGQPLALRNPGAIRPWQHVLEPLSGYLRLGQALLAGEPVSGAWNFGPAADATLTVLALTDRMRAYWPGLALSPSPGPHPHEAGILRLDCAKANRELGWRSNWDATTTIELTMAWYGAFHQRGELLSAGQPDRYVGDARAGGQGWAR